MPPAPAGVDWKHPLAARLFLFLVRNHTAPGNTAVAFTRHGVVASEGLTTLNPANGFTIAADPARSNTASFTNHITMGQYVAAGDNATLGIQWYGTTNNVVVYMRQNSGDASGQSVGARIGNHMAWVYPGSGNTLVYDEGRQSTTVTSSYNTISNLYTGSTTLFGFSPVLSLTIGRYAAVWLRALSPTEVAQFRSNPYQLLRY